MDEKRIKRKNTFKVIRSVLETLDHPGGCALGIVVPGGIPETEQGDDRQPAGYLCHDPE